MACDLDKHWDVVVQLGYLSLSSNVLFVLDVQPALFLPLNFDRYCKWVANITSCDLVPTLGERKKRKKRHALTNLAFYGRALSRKTTKLNII